MNSISAAVAAFVALRGLSRGVQEDTGTTRAGVSDQLPQEGAGVAQPRSENS